MSYAIQTVFVAFAILGAVLLAAFVGATILGYVERRRLNKRVVLWRATRPRATIIRFHVIPPAGFIPEFHLPRELQSVIPMFTTDPMTGERVQFGWADSELAEAYRRQKEFCEVPS